MRKLFLFSLLIISCQKNQTPPIFPANKEFSEFYLKFHRDTAYQNAHIIFPMEGLPTDADSTTIASGTFRWNKDNWTHHHLFSDADYKIEFVPINDFLIIETIRHSSGEMGMLRRWAKMDKEWYLIYYAGINRINKGGN